MSRLFKMQTDSLFTLVVLICAFAIAQCDAFAQTQSDQLDALKRKVEFSTDGRIRLPLRLHIMTGLRFRHPAKSLTCWFNDSHVEALLQEINLIWKQANVEWFVESVIKHQPLNDDASTIRQIAEAKRDEDGRSDPKRIPLVYSFFNARKHNPVIQNLYFFPFIGNTSQGYAGDPRDRSIRMSNHAVVGIWSNKYSGDGVPYRTPLGERSRGETPDDPPQKRNYFDKGSLGRTCAHELGHNLRLAHPDPKTQKSFQRLMGGNRPGYRLTPEEIATARPEALKRAKSFATWNPNLLRKQIVGTYRHESVENQWQEGRITRAAKPGEFQWINKAGKSWSLSLDTDTFVLQTGNDNPFFDLNPESGREFRLTLRRRSKSGKSFYQVSGFGFQQGYFERQGD